MVPDTVHSGFADPQTALSVILEERPLPFESRHTISIVDGFDQPFMPWTFFPPMPGVEGGNPVLTSSVPEPATWAMLVSGFMAVGTMIRPRQRPCRAAS